MCVLQAQPLQQKIFLKHACVLFNKSMCENKTSKLTFSKVAKRGVVKTMHLMHNYFGDANPNQGNRKTIVQTSPFKPCCV